jgi:hypothetical protein
MLLTRSKLFCLYAANLIAVGHMEVSSNIRSFL